MGSLALLATGVSRNGHCAIPNEELRKVEAALPTEAFVKPAKPRKILIFDLNVGYGGHRSIPHSNHAFTLMGQRTGAFETVISRDPAVFTPDALKQFDAVFFNNTFGMVFDDPALQQSLADFVYSGGGMLATHAATYTFIEDWKNDRWPEFGLMLGARGGTHRENTEHVYIKRDDPEHPVNQAFGGKDFEYRDEFFRLTDPYSRDRVRVLLSIDTAKTDLNQGRSFGEVVRADNDYALAWVRNYGRGRTFYCTIAHNPYVFWDRMMLKFYFGAIQFALGDLPAPTTPSAKLTPAVHAQEKLGWRLGMRADSTGTLFDAIDRAAANRLFYAGASSTQNVSGAIAKPFDARLTNDERKQIRLKLDAAGVRLLAYGMDKLPREKAECQATFEFARKMGVEAIVAAVAQESLDAVEKLANEYGINVAMRGVEGPESLAKMLEGRGTRIGACGDFTKWFSAGIDPVKAARDLKNRIVTVSVPEQPEALLTELRNAGAKPTMFGIEPGEALGKRVEAFNDLSIKLAKRV